ncbi:PilZ domain-containing protein [Desulforhopalus singaporensis]|uniref:PilZ domain-containing protein n=1 Tax=Desulforhopalus singaporensis TaxID=91360 RepID=A0A1H0JLG6_9BACT|nr:PilZ domain-containing protein [Desulforhopalus singaporensis]SDO44627.1 PilZ domain-containing protein [Desulforhopalus singaporensis]
MSIQERRRYVRYDILHLLDYILYDSDGNPGPYSMGRTLDVSLDGIKLETQQLVNSGTIIRITIGLKNDLIEIEGIVTHASKSAGTYAAGVVFSKVSQQARETLKKYIEAFSAQKKE